MDHEVTVELKNDIQIRGTLKSVDQYLNIKLDDISVVEEVKYPHLVCARFRSFWLWTVSRDEATEARVRQHLIVQLLCMSAKEMDGEDG